MTADDSTLVHPTRYADIPELLAALGRLPPQRPALTFYRGRVRAGGFTYGELLDVTRGVTRRFGELGIRAGDCLAVLAPNRLEVPPLLLAAWRLDAVLVPLNPTTSPEDWAYILEHSRARAIFGTRELLDRLTRRPEIVCAFEDDPEWSRARALPAAPASASAPPGSLGDAMAVVLYTSGTTGNPKGVALRQGSLLANAWSMAKNFGLDGATQLAVLPLYHAHALGFGLMSALTTGGHLVFAERFDPFSWSEVVRAESAVWTSVVPTLLPPLLQVGVRRDRLPSLRGILVSSAPLTATLASEFEGKTGIPLLQGWGLSEYTNFACCLSPALPDAERRRRLVGAELTGIGGPLAGTEVKVMGPDGAPLPAGQRGELAIRGHSTMLEYFRDADATTAVLAPDGWLRTGDEGFFTLFGDDPVFFIAGRIKETIIRDGDKFSPLAIERRLCAELPEIEGHLVVLGFPHQGHGEEIGAYLEAPDIDDELRERLTRAVAALPLDLRPKVILHGAAAIPRTHTGKIQRRKLQPLFARFNDCRGALHIERI